MTATTETCWADPLTRTERARLAKMLARHCKRFWDAREALTARPRSRYTPAEIRDVLGVTHASIEMSDLHVDVTERAA